MKRLAVRRYVCTYRNEPMCCVLEAMPWCVVRLYCVRELQPHYIVAVYGIGSLTSRSFSALRGRAEAAPPPVGATIEGRRFATGTVSTYRRGHAATAWRAAAAHWAETDGGGRSSSLKALRWALPKGQIISECPLEILDFPKIPPKI